MNKPLLKTRRKVGSMLSSGPKFILALMLWGVTVATSSAQVDCDIIMACNDNIQVSLGTDCTELLAPDMLLEDPAYDESFFTVTLWRENGAVVADNILRQPMIGETLEAKVQLNGCDISCWGNLTVEDKLKPEFVSCPSPIEVECEDNLNPGVVVPRPIAIDACTAVTLNYEDVTEKLLCDQPYTMTITRKWIAEDLYGNSETCEQVINVLRASIDDVTFPDDFVDGDAIECGTAIPYLDNGAPDPSYTGYPDGIDCPNIQHYYDDIIFDLCGNGKKVLRQWNVLDWCSGRDTIGNQVIKILDTRAPVCVAPNDFVYEITTDEGVCTGTFDVPEPNIVFECSDYDYIVGYKLRDDDGQPFDNPIYDNVVKVDLPNGDYFYRISDLPQDTTWIVYTITDDCGHKSQCFTEVFVEDDENPTAICEGYSVVTLGDDGWADIDAISVDDHSKDNCEIESYEIKRLTNACGFPSDLEFGPDVNFCCNDVSEDDNYYIKVVLRVTDASGNYNDCVANVKVQDKKDPLIFCPDNIDIECDGDTSVVNTGMATATDNCSVEITHNDVINLNDCGLGTISRRWTATDPSGRSRSCTQTIRVIDSDPFSIDDVDFPADITINGCSAEDADPQAIGSFPTYDNEDCAEIAVSYEDVRFEIQDACFKITRKWRLANWCDYNAQNPNYIEGVQKITFINSEAPTFISSCSNRTIESTDIDCEEYVEHTAEATDDCTPSHEIKYRWTYDEDNNGSIDQTGVGSFTAGTYPKGTHRFTFYAIDLCDNETACSYLFTIKDGKAPTPICHKDITWVVDEDGQAEVWASDFNIKSFDLCDSEDNLTFSFNAAGNQPAMSFDCDDIPNGIAAEIDLQMYVFDSDGNSEYCEVTLILQDSELTDACTDDPDAMGRIAGSVINHDELGIENIDVQIEQLNASSMKHSYTDQEGHYYFPEAEYYEAYIVAPKSNDDIMNGVSTLDLVLMQRHILEVDQLDSAKQLIAADINADDRISASDLVGLRKVILGITNEYQNNNSWRFVPANYEFESNDHPWGFPETFSISNMILDEMNADFLAIKIGDVNNSSSSNARSSETSSRNASVDLIIDNQVFLNGNTVEVPVIAGSNMDVFGLQLNMLFDEYALDLLDINSGKLMITSGMYNLASNNLKMSVANQQAEQIKKGDVLFTLVFKSYEDGDLTSLSIQETGLQSELYSASLEEYKVELNMRNNVLDGSGLHLTANPNPFSEFTYITYEMPESNSATLSIFDATGAMVYQKTKDGAKGVNNWILNDSDLSGKPGIYVFKLEYANETRSGKMILIK